MAAGGMVHPEMLDGRRVWKDPEVEEIVQKLHLGDPTLGWEGDPALALYRTEDGRWELWRLEDDGVMRRFMRSTPGAKLDNRLIMELVAHDVRRGYNVHNAITAHNAQLEKAQEKAAEERMAPAVDKVLWGLKRDVGHLY